jgi:centromere/kinetochore protein ZW10
VISQGERYDTSMWKELEIPACHCINLLTNVQNTIRLGSETADSTIRSLFMAMEDLIRYLVDHLPPEFIQPLSDAMMPDLSARLKEFWLDTAVPSALDDILEYQKSLAQVQDFVGNLQSLSWPGSEKFEDWIFEAPKIWISKRRETALDWIRNQLELGKHLAWLTCLRKWSLMDGYSQWRHFILLRTIPFLANRVTGVGSPHLAQHIERRMVDKEEQRQIASSGNMVTQDWDAAWESEEENPLPSASNRASLEEERRAREVTPAAMPAAADDDDVADAWGWGDEDAADNPVPESVDQPASGASQPHAQNGSETREVTLAEPYRSSSIPQPIFSTVAGIFEDAARLTSAECVTSCVFHIWYLTSLTGSINLPSPPQHQGSSIYPPWFSQCTEQYLHFITHVIKVATCK